MSQNNKTYPNPLDPRTDEEFKSEMEEWYVFWNLKRNQEKRRNTDYEYDYDFEGEY